MPKKSPSHFVAHIVTAFVNRLTEVIHEVAAARAHSEVLGALGGVTGRGKRVGRPRARRAEAKDPTREPTKTTGRKKKTTVEPKARIKAKGTTARSTAAETAPTKKNKRGPAAKDGAKLRARAKAATPSRPASSPRKPRPAVTSGAVSMAGGRAQAKQASGAAVSPATPASSEVAAVPPASVLPLQDAAPPTAG